MSAPNAKIVVTKEMENKMEFEKTHSELVAELEVLVMANQKPEMKYPVMYGTLLAYITKEQLQHAIDLRNN